MTNAVAICLAAMILALVAVDAIWFSGEYLVLFGKQIFAAIEYLSFWR